MTTEVLLTHIRDPEFQKDQRWFLFELASQHSPDQARPRQTDRALITEAAAVAARRMGRRNLLDLDTDFSHAPLQLTKWMHRGSFIPRTDRTDTDRS